MSISLCIITKDEENLLENFLNHHKDLADEKFSGRKKFKQRFLKFFGATKEKLEQENKELKIELKKQEVKDD